MVNILQSGETLVERVVEGRNLTPIANGTKLKKWSSAWTTPTSPSHGINWKQLPGRFWRHVPPHSRHRAILAIISTSAADRRFEHREHITELTSEYPYLDSVSNTINPAATPTADQSATRGAQAATPPAKPRRRGFR